MSAPAPVLEVVASPPPPPTEPVARGLRGAQVHFADAHQRDEVCRTLLSMGQVQDFWGVAGPTDAALAATAGPLGWGTLDLEAELLLRLASALWTGHGDVGLLRARTALRPSTFSALTELFAAIAAGPGAIGFWLSTYAAGAPAAPPGRCSDEWHPTSERTAARPWACAMCRRTFCAACCADSPVDLCTSCLREAREHALKQAQVRRRTRAFEMASRDIQAAPSTYRCPTCRDVPSLAPCRRCHLLEAHALERAHAAAELRAAQLRLRAAETGSRVDLATLWGQLLWKLRHLPLIQLHVFSSLKPTRLLGDGVLILTAPSRPHALQLTDELAAAVVQTCLEHEAPVLALLAAGPRETR